MITSAVKAIWAQLWFKVQINLGVLSLNLQLLPTKNVHGVHDFVSFGDQSANAEKVITPHTRHQSLILVCISYWQMGNTFAQ